MAIDDATAGFLALLAESAAKPLHEMTPQEARDFGGKRASRSPAGGSRARCTVSSPW